MVFTPVGFPAASLWYTVAKRIFSPVAAFDTVPVVLIVVCFFVSSKSRGFIFLVTAVYFGFLRLFSVGLLLLPVVP